MSKYHYNLIKWNLDKYDCPPVEYNKFQIFLLMENANTHLVSVFKDHLLYDDTTEFFKEYYKKKNIYEKLKLIFEYYESSSYLFPNYTALNEGKYIYKNIIKKQKLIDYLEDLEEKKQEEDKKQLYKNPKNNLQNDNNSSNSKIFDTTVYNNIIQETANSSKINEIFCVNVKNSENGDSVSSLLKLTEQMNSKTQREKNSVKIYVSRYAIKRELNKVKDNLTAKNELLNADSNTERVNTTNINNSTNNPKKLTINIPNTFKGKINNNIIINYNNQNINNCYIENNYFDNKKYINVKTEPSQSTNTKKPENLNKKILHKTKTTNKMPTTKKLTINIPNNIKFIKHERLNTDFLTSRNKMTSPINNQSKTNIRNKNINKGKNVESYTKSINRNILKNINLINPNKQNQDTSKNHKKHFSTNSYNLQNTNGFSADNKMRIIQINRNNKRKISSKNKSELFTKKIKHIKNRKTALITTILSVSSKKLNNENSNSNSTNNINKSSNIKNKSQGIKNRKK